MGNKQRLLQQSTGDELGDDDDYLMDYDSESGDPKDGWLCRYESREFGVRIEEMKEEYTGGLVDF